MKIKINNYCLCGCGQIVKIGNNYINGHNNTKHGKYRKPCYCIDCGKEISVGSKRCRSCQSKKLFCNKEFKRKWNKMLKGNQHFKGHKHSEKQKRKISETTKQQWQSGQFDGVFKSPTKPEKEIMRILDKLKIDYIFQFRPKNYGKTYDFYIPKRNLLIEFDGIYWHSLPKVKERDVEKTQYANKNGYDLLRINEYSLDNFWNKAIGFPIEK